MGTKAHQKFGGKAVGIVRESI